MKRSPLFLSLVAVLAAAAVAIAPTEAATLLDDAFADGSRLETNLPNESAFFVGKPDDVAVFPGFVRYDIGSSSTKAHTYFTSGNQFSSLEVGDTLSVSVSLIPRVSMNLNDTSRSFRFGVFHDPSDPQQLDDTNDDGGGGNSSTPPFDPWTDAQGYAVQIAMLSESGNTRAPFDLGKRTDLGNSSLLGSSGAYTKTSGGDPVVMSVNEEYTYTMDISKTSATVTDVTVSLSQTGVGQLSSFSVSDNGTDLGSSAPYDDFSFIHFRWSNDTETADIFDITRVAVTGPVPVPEPGAGAICLIFGTMFALRRRC